MNEFKSYMGEVTEICDNGDAIVTLPPELCDEMGWKEGTVLNIEYKDGAIYLSEVKSETK